MVFQRNDPDRRDTQVAMGYVERYVADDVKLNSLPEHRLRSHPKPSRSTRNVQGETRSRKLCRCVERIAQGELFPPRRRGSP